MLVQHDNNKLLGRTASGTLKLQRRRRRPSSFVARCLTRNWAATLTTMIKRGDLNACSFGFMLGDRSDDSWDEEDIEDEEDFEPDDDEDKKQKRSRSERLHAKQSARSTTSGICTTLAL